MTTNDFNALAGERDSILARALYHSTSMVRIPSREWILAELKELELEADRLHSLASPAQRGVLEQCKHELMEIRKANQGRFSREETVAFEAARNDVFGHVHEPASTMLSEVMDLVDIIGELKKYRERIEDIAGTVTPKQGLR